MKRSRVEIGDVAVSQPYASAVRESAKRNGAMVISDSSSDDDGVTAHSRRRKSSRRSSTQADGESDHDDEPLRRRLNTDNGESLRARFGSLLDELCDREHANLFIDFATTQVPPDYATIVGGPPVDLRMVLDTLTAGGYEDVSSLNDAVLKVFDNTSTYYGRRTVQDTQLLARRGKTLRRWWVEQVRRLTSTHSEQDSNDRHRSQKDASSRARQSERLLEVASAHVTSTRALQMVEQLTEQLGQADGEMTEEEAQTRIAHERELMHAQRVLNNNIATSAYLRSGPYEQFDSIVARHDIGTMNVMCTKCFALRFACESPTFCCNNGKIDLPRRKDPPPVLKALMLDQSQRG